MVPEKISASWSCIYKLFLYRKNLGNLLLPYDHLTNLFSPLPQLFAADNLTVDDNVHDLPHYTICFPPYSSLAAFHVRFCLPYILTMHHKLKPQSNFIGRLFFNLVK